MPHQTITDKEKLTQLLTKITSLHKKDIAQLFTEGILTDEDLSLLFAQKKVEIKLTKKVSSEQEEVRVFNNCSLLRLKNNTLFICIHDDQGDVRQMIYVSDIMKGKITLEDGEFSIKLFLKEESQQNKEN